MSLISLVITLAIVGVIIYLIETYLPIDATIKRLIHLVVIIAVILWLLAVFGVLADVSTIPVPRAN